MCSVRSFVIHLLLGGVVTSGGGMIGPVQQGLVTSLYLYRPLYVLTSIFIIFCLSSSAVSVSSLILAVPVRECLGKNSCVSFTFPIAILNGTCFLHEAK